MKKLSYSFITLLAIFFICSASLIAQEVILSDEFDNGDGKWTSGWIDNTTTTVTVSIDNTGKLSGANSYKLAVVKGGPDTYRIQRNANCPLLAGYLYTVSFLAVADREVTINVLFEIAGDPYTKRLNELPVITTSPQVITYTMSSSENVPSNQLKLHFGGPNNNNYTIWVDSIVVTQEPDPAFVTQWGFLGGRQGNWISTPGDAPGGASIGVDATSSVEWAAIRGGLIEPVTATTDKAILVTGNIEFVGSGIDTWSGLRYGLFMHDAAGTLITTNVDSTRWSGSESSSHGYMFTPISGTNRVTDGVSGGVGTQWVRISGNYISTSSGSGPIYTGGVTPQKPARAVADAGKYAFAFSVQPLANGTKEVRFYLIKGDAANSATSTYYFGGSFIDTSSIAPTFNGVVFAVHAGGSGANPDLRGVKLTDVQVDLGTPFELPEAPWQAYYVTDWGFSGGNLGGWSLTPGEFDGDVTIGGTAAPTGWSAVRGGIDPYVLTTEQDRALIVTGKIELASGGFQDLASLRYGLFYSDSAGTVKQDANLDSNWVWTGTDRAHSGYLFVPPSGTNIANWSGVNGTWGAITNGTWWDISSKSTVLGAQLQTPANAVAGPGIYDFAISVSAQASGNLVRATLSKADKSFSWETSTIVTATASKINCVAFAVNNSTTTAMNLIEIKVDRGPDIVTDVNGEEIKQLEQLPTAYTLSQNYPNPFNPTTTIEFSLPQNSEVNLVVYDISGRVVAELAKGKFVAGYHKFNFDATNLATGVYFVKLKAGNFVSVNKAVLVK